MAIGSPSKADRLDQLRTYAKVQVWSGFRSTDEVRADVLEAVRDEESDPGRARALADEFVAAAREELAAAARTWPEVTAYDRLQDALGELERSGIVVLQAIDDHWTANETLAELEDAGRRPRGLAYFTHTDVWHAVEHGMLELNVWHGSTANVAPGDELLTSVCDTLERHGLPAHFDEGRIEVTVAWQRRPAALES